MLLGASWVRLGKVWSFVVGELVGELALCELVMMNSYWMKDRGIVKKNTALFCYRHFVIADYLNLFSTCNSFS